MRIQIKGGIWKNTEASYRQHACTSERVHSVVMHNPFNSNLLLACMYVRSMHEGLCTVECVC